MGEERQKGGGQINTPKLALLKWHNLQSIGVNIQAHDLLQGFIL